ncbi:hypothetical protein FS837_003586 [Tulasnella sp. UAMH 9824]|nr:hypothetical protein FS837_003586 [Tulasnella sp. UAMH 9824]
MPLLESLELPFSKFGADIIQLLRPYLQNLRQIKAVDWWPDMAMPELHNLRTLILSEWTIGPGTTHLLAACANLLTLSIKLSVQSAAVERGKPPTIFALPGLQELKLEFKWWTQCDFITRLDTPFHARGSLRLNHMGPGQPDAEVIDSLCHFVFPHTVTSPILDAAVVSIYGRIQPLIWNQFARIMYSAGARTIDLGAADSTGQERRFVDAIITFQARLNNTPLKIILIDYSKEDNSLPFLAHAGVRTILVKSGKGISAVLTSSGSNGSTLPSGMPYDAEWPFDRDSSTASTGEFQVMAEKDIAG